MAIEDPQKDPHQLGITLSLRNLALVFIIFFAVVGVEFLLDVYRIVEYKALVLLMMSDSVQCLES